MAFITRQQSTGYKLTKMVLNILVALISHENVKCLIWILNACLTCCRIVRHFRLVSKSLWPETNLIDPRNNNTPSPLARTLLLPTTEFCVRRLSSIRTGRCPVQSSNLIFVVSVNVCPLFATTCATHSKCNASSKGDHVKMFLIILCHGVRMVFAFA